MILTVEAGWYDDPLDPGGLRWWDGTTWTQDTMPGAGVAVPAAEPAAPPATIPSPPPSPLVAVSVEAPRRVRPTAIGLAVALCLGVAVAAFFVARAIASDDDVETAAEVAETTTTVVAEATTITSSTTTSTTTSAAVTATSAPPTTVAATPASPVDRIGAADAANPNEFRRLSWDGSLPLVDQPSELVAFSSPSGNVTCIWYPGSGAEVGVTCGMGERADPPPPPADNCGEISWADHYIGLGPSGFEDGFCTGGQEVPLAAEVLPYGSSLSAGDFACLSEETGVTCVHLRTGRGFTAARAGVDDF